MLKNIITYHNDIYIMQYFKITNGDDETHYGYKYVDGPNVLDKPFQMHGSCVPGGLYFTTWNHIPKFYHYGIYLRVVRLPLDDPDFIMVEDPDGDKFRANKIILDKDEKYSLFDYETYEKFGLDIAQNKYLLYFASK